MFSKNVKDLAVHGVALVQQFKSSQMCDRNRNKIFVEL